VLPEAALPLVGDLRSILREPFWKELERWVS
jgi:hypothetical protein